MRAILVFMGLFYGLFTDAPDAHEHAFIFFAGAFVLCFIKIGDCLEKAITDAKPIMFWFHVGEVIQAFYKRFFTKKKGDE